MFKYLVSLLLLMVTQAHAGLSFKACEEGVDSCGLVFVSVPYVTGLTTANCGQENEVIYEVFVKNESPAPIAFNFYLVDNDSNDPGAVTIDFADSTCVEGQPLAPGATCSIALSFQPCVEGQLSWDLIVKPKTTQKPLVDGIDTIVGCGEPNYNAYVVNYESNSILYCPLNPDGTFGDSSIPVSPNNSIPTATPCHTVAMIFAGSDALDGPANIAFTRTINGMYAYITNIGQSDAGHWSGTTVTVCPVISASEFGSVTMPCFNTTGNGTFSQPNGVTINAEGDVLYVANGGDNPTNNISVCPINANGSLQTCTVTPTETTQGYGSNDLALNANQTNSLVYILDYNQDAMTYPLGLINICSVDSVTGLFSNCFLEPLTTAGSYLNGPIGIALSSDQLTAYVTNLAGDDVDVCAIDQTPGPNFGTFTSCTAQTAHGSLDAPGTPFLTGASYPGGASIYIPNNDIPKITFCDIDFVKCYYLNDSLFATPNDVAIIPVCEE